mmetsp:Transcript_12186/g.29100  ORF Transcript_12186/g.29100 Transcript_12186/m.29100 type:complete len:331 (-) Transcript_12186:15-1007(-)
MAGNSPRCRRVFWLLTSIVILRCAQDVFLLPRAPEVSSGVLRRLLLLTSSAQAFRPASVHAEGFDPFGEQQKKKAPKDLKNPPADAQVTKSGLKFKILKPADCETKQCAKPRPFDKVTVDFTGYELDGRVFDSSRKRGRQTFPVGQVIRGWTEGLLNMNVGETARLWIPTDLAFGSAGKGGPAGDIVVDVTLYGLKRGPKPPPTPEDIDGPPSDAERTKSGLVTKILKVGNGTDVATEATKVTVEYYGWTPDGQLFDAALLRGQSTIELQQKNVPKGFWEGVQMMSTGETRRLWVPPALGYGSERDDGGPSGPLVFDVYLQSFEKGGFFR